MPTPCDDYYSDYYDDNESWSDCDDWYVEEEDIDEDLLNEDISW